MEWFISNWEMITAVITAIMGIITDIVLGTLPDKVTKYPGALLSLGHKMYMHGKEFK